MYELKVTTVHTIKSESGLEKCIHAFKRGGHTSEDMAALRRGETVSIEDTFYGNDIKTQVKLDKVGE